jgi:hypothetical protein
MPKGDYFRRTKFMIAQENNRILEYYKSGLSHRQIIDIIGLSPRQYWKRVHKISEEDMEILLMDQTKESRAFLHQRMMDKLQSYELQAQAIAHNKANKTTDRLAAFHLLRQLAADEYSLSTYGPSSFIIPELNDKLVGGNRSSALILSKAVTDTPRDSSEDTTTDPGPVF